MRTPRLFSVLAAGLAAFISLTSHAAPKTDFSVCWTIYAGWMPWEYGAA
ncbi:MAG: lipid kinase, partial [Pseudomonas sp.]